MASRWSGRNSSSLVLERTGALWIGGATLGPQEGPRLAVARPAAGGGDIEVPDGRIQRDHREGRPHVDDLGEGRDELRLLGREDRPLQFRPAATSHAGPAWGYARDERIGQIRSAVGRGAERHAVAKRGLRCPTSRLSSLGCEEMESASS